MIKETPAFYEIIHLPTGMAYGGSSANAYKRINWHRTNLAAGKHSSKKLQAIYTSWPDFEIRIYYTVRVDEAKSLESEYLEVNLGGELNCNAHSSYAPIPETPQLVGMTPQVLQGWAGMNYQSPKAMSAYENRKYAEFVMIEIDGVKYSSIAAAVRILGVCHSTLSRRLTSRFFTNYIRL